MYKIAVIGGEHIISSFRALGLSVYKADTGSKAREILIKLGEDKEHAIIFITEKLGKEIIKEINTLNADPIKNVVLIPDNLGETGLAKEMISNLTRKSLGAPLRGLS